MRSARFKKSAALALLVVLTAFACCAQAKSFVLGDTTFNAENGEPDVDPHNEYSGWACIRYGIGETLFRHSRGMETEPWLAEKCELIDAFTWKITLRGGIRFTSGRELDAQAAKECLEHLVRVHARARGDLDIDSMAADGQTLIIKTEKPRPALPDFLCDPYSCMIDVSAGAENGIVSGTGPYKAVELITDERLELVKNEDYRSGAPKPDGITVLTISDGDTLTMALQSGAIDAAYGLPYASYPLFENDGFEYTGTPTSRVFFLSFNFKSPLCAPEIRKAIAMGIDKRSFVDVLLGGNGCPAVGAFPESFPFGGQKLTATAYDPDGAERLLEESGWTDEDGDGIREKDGRRLTIRWLTYPSRQELPLLAEYAQYALGKIGIDVSINCTASAGALKSDPTKWDVYASAMVTCPTGDPEYFFASCALEKSAANSGAYRSEKLERLAEEMSETFETEKRASLAIEMQQTLIDDAAFVFCSHLKMGMVMRKGVKGLSAHPCDYYEITSELDVD